MIADIADLAEAEQAAVVTVHPTPVGFRHELARRAVEGTLPMLARMALNEEVLAALLAREAPDLDRIVHHAVQAGADAVVVDARAGGRAPGLRGRAPRTRVRSCTASSSTTPSCCPSNVARRSARPTRGRCSTPTGGTTPSDAAERAVRIREELGEPGPLGWALAFLAMQYQTDHRMGPARESAERALPVLDAVGDTVEHASALVFLAILFTVVDRERDGRELAGAALGTPCRRSRARRTRREPPGAVAGRGGRGRAGVADRTPELAHAAAALLPRTEQPGRAWQRGELLRYLKRLGAPAEPFPGCPEVFATGLRGDWRAAADLWGDIGDPYERALELADSGAPEPTLEALAVLDALGAAPAATLVRRRLRALGVERLPRGPQPATRRNPAGLTSRQVEILRLVADGLTNAEIAERLVVSVRTVDHHVSAVLQKLGVPSRQAARAAAGALTCWADPRASGPIACAPPAGARRWPCR